jgi:hypothetical protein
MLREIPHTRQVPGEPARRWFSGRALDIVVWHGGDGRVTGFQIEYEVSAARRKALTWREGQGYRHEDLDEGETEPLRYKESPMMLPDGLLDRDRLLMLLDREGGGLDPVLLDFLRNRIAQAP